MTSNDLLTLGDLNLAEFQRESCRWHEHTEIVEKGSLLLTCGPDSFAGLSFAMRVGRDQAPSADDFLRTAKAFFAERHRGFSVQARAHLDGDLEEACRAQEFPRLSASPGMVLEAPLAETPVPGGVSVRPVLDAVTGRDLGAVAVESYATMGLRAKSGALLFGRPERLVAPHLLGFVAYLGDRPAACALALLSHGIGGIYWVGTIPSARGKGLAERCTRAAGNAAFERGARCVILQASAQGEPIYRRMGYREFTRYPWYLVTTR